MKQTSLWNEILNHENYGKKWQAKEGMTAKKLESLVASEVHSRLVGTQGEAILNRIAKEKGSKGIVGKLKQWILDFWKELKGTFSNWSQEEIDALTLDDFNKMTVRDLVDKVNLKEQQNTINQQNNSSNNKIEYGNDFRRIQEGVRKDSQGSSVAGRDIGEDARRRLARITKLELDSNTSPQRNSQWVGVSNKGVRYNIIGEIPAQLFHDIFEVVRYYTENGELVDLHNIYDNCKCYLTEDALAGFATEKNGNLVSEF